MVGHTTIDEGMRWAFGGLGRGGWVDSKPPESQGVAQSRHDIRKARSSQEVPFGGPSKAEESEGVAEEEREGGVGGESRR